MADTYDSSLPDDSVPSHARRPSSLRVPGAPRSVVPVPMLAAPPSPLARQNNLILVLGFALLIALGTVVLHLPVATTGEPLTWSEAFFTATSATTVTGLGVVSAANDLSRFGQLVVLLLIELGGVGFITFLVCFSVTLLLLAARPSGLLPAAFEAISAFSNTGYSLGETLRLTEWGRMLIAGTMFWGRLGPLTLVILLAQVEHPSLARYPTERIVIG